MKLTPEEICRKLLHLFALLMPLGIFYVPKMSAFSYYFVPCILGILFFLSVILEFLRFKFPAIQKIFFTLFGSMLRKEEAVKITGSTWVIGAAFLCSILFKNQPHISLIVLSLFILGDAAAALVGISTGRIKIGKKSLEGSLACFFSCAALFYFVIPLLPEVLDSWAGKTPHIIVWATALVITLFELIPLKLTSKLTINDNLAVPVIAGYVIFGLQKMM